MMSYFWYIFGADVTSTTQTGEARPCIKQATALTNPEKIQFAVLVLNNYIYSLQIVFIERWTLRLRLLSEWMEKLYLLPIQEWVCLLQSVKSQVRPTDTTEDGSNLTLRTDTRITLDFRVRRYQNSWTSHWFLPAINYFYAGDLG